MYEQLNQWKTSIRNSHLKTTNLVLHCSNGSDRSLCPVCLMFWLLRIIVDRFETLPDYFWRNLLYEYLGRLYYSTFKDIFHLHILTLVSVRGPTGRSHLDELNWNTGSHSCVFTTIQTQRMASSANPNDIFVHWHGFTETGSDVYTPRTFSHNFIGKFKKNKSSDLFVIFSFHWNI